MLYSSMKSKILFFILSNTVHYRIHVVGEFAPAYFKRIFVKPSKESKETSHHHSRGSWFKWIVALGLSFGSLRWCSVYYDLLRNVQSTDLLQDASSFRIWIPQGLGFLHGSKVLSFSKNQEFTVPKIWNISILVVLLKCVKQTIPFFGWSNTTSNSLSNLAWWYHLTWVCVAHSTPRQA